jgi:phage-related baseplate assembly protein
MAKKINTTKLMSDDDVLEIIDDELTKHGMAVSILSDGVMVAVTADKLRELLAEAMNNSDSRMVMFIHNDDEDIQMLDDEYLN